MTPPADIGDLSDDIRLIFQELAADASGPQRATGECHPAIDVSETDDSVQVVIDLPGLTAATVRVVFRADVLLIAGVKAPPVQTDATTYHQVEREFGRFARGVRLSGAFDIARARARMQQGELTIVLPKLADRRGEAHRIPVIEDDPRA